MLMIKLHGCVVFRTTTIANIDLRLLIIDDFVIQSTNIDERR